jgi:hypothetical protein
MGNANIIGEVFWQSVLQKPLLTNPEILHTLGPRAQTAVSDCAQEEFLWTIVLFLKTLHLIKRSHMPSHRADFKRT